MLVKELIMSNFVNGYTLVMWGGTAYTVSTVTSLWTIQRGKVVRSPAEATNLFSTPKRTHRLWDQLWVLFNVHRLLFRRGERG